MKTSQSLHVIGSVHCGTEVVEDSQSQSRFGSVQYYCANDVKIYPMEYAFLLLNDEGHYLYLLHHIVCMQCMTHVLKVCFEI